LPINIHIKFIALFFAITAINHISYAQILNCEDGEEEFSLVLYDTWGDGWSSSFFNNNTHTVEINNTTYGAEFTFGLEYSYDLCIDPNGCIEISFSDNGPWQLECSFDLIDNDGNVFYSGNSNSTPFFQGIDCGCTDPQACNYDPDALTDDGSCIVPTPFCTEDATTYEATTNSQDAPNGNFYGCLDDQPNPAWFYLQTSEAGDIDIFMESTANVDIDFILWGPYTNLDNSCNSLTQDNVVDCSYSVNSVETASLTNANAGDFYILLITNYSNQPTSISFEQSSGDGASDCDIVCEVIASENVEICNGNNTQLSATASDTYSWSPTTGLSNPNISNPIAFPSITTTYVVTGTTTLTNGSLCESTDTIVLTVSENPPNAIIDICSNNTALYYATGLVGITGNNNTGSWSGPSTLGGTFQGVYNSNNNGEGIYTYTVSDDDGCDLNYPINVNNPSDAGNDALIDICLDENEIDLFLSTGSSEETGNWSPLLSGGYLGTFDPITNPSGTYTYTISNPECGNSQADITVNVIELIPPQIISD
jgi:hypothetical protein